MSDERTIPNLHFDMKPIVLSTIHGNKHRLEVSPSMYAIYPHPRMICEICEESKIGEICIDGFVKTQRGTKIPVWGYINYKPEEDECHCNGELYDEIPKDIEVSVQNGWHYAPEEYNDKVELEDDEFFMKYTTTVCNEDAYKLYRILLGKEDINYYESDESDESDESYQSD